MQRKVQMSYSTADISKKGTSKQHSQSYVLIGIITIFSVICIVMISIDELIKYFYISVLSGAVGFSLILYWQKKYIDLQENALVHLWLVPNGAILLTFGIIPIAAALFIAKTVMLILLLLKIMAMNIARPTNGKFFPVLLRLLNSLLFAGVGYGVFSTIVVLTSGYDEYASKYITSGDLKFVLPLIVVALVAALIWLGLFSKKINLDQEPTREITVYPVVDFKPNYPDRNVFIRLAIGDLALRSAYWEFFLFLPLLIMYLILIVLFVIKWFIFPSLSDGSIISFGLGALPVFMLMGLYGVVKCFNNVSKKIWQFVTVIAVIFNFALLIATIVRPL